MVAHFTQKVIEEGIAKALQTMNTPLFVLIKGK